MNKKAELRKIVQHRTTLSGRIFDNTVQSLIILSIIAFSIETLPNLSQTQQSWLHAVEIAIVAAFTLEYVLRVYVAEKPSHYIFSFYGIIDLLAILPFYLSTGVDMRSLRIFRLIRLIRVFKLFRYSSAMQRMTRAVKIAKEELILFSVVTLMLLYLSAVGIYYFENEAQPDVFSSIFHSLWWAVATLTTVGYGDIYPITIGGKIFTFFILMIGLGIVAVPASLLSSALARARQEESKTDIRDD